MSEREVEREGLSNSSSVFKDNRKVWGSISFRGIFALLYQPPAVLMSDLCRAPPFGQLVSRNLSGKISSSLPKQTIEFFCWTKLKATDRWWGLGRGLRGEGGEPKERIGGKRGHCSGDGGGGSIISNDGNICRAATANYFAR